MTDDAVREDTKSVHMVAATDFGSAHLVAEGTGTDVSVLQPVYVYHPVTGRKTTMLVTHIGYPGGWHAEEQDPLPRRTKG